MQHGWRAAALVAAAVTLATISGCGLSSDAGAAAAASSSAAAAASSAEHAKPGSYGSPADPSLPNPTNVATDPPAATSHPTATAAGGVQVGVNVTYSGWNTTAGQVEVGSYVAGIVESGGTCTLTLTKAGMSVQTSSPGRPNAASTSCGQLAISGARLSSGAWRAVVGYRSTAAEGTSAAVEVTVP